MSDVSVARDLQSVYLHIADMTPCMQMRVEYRLQDEQGQTIAGTVDHTVHVLPELTAELRADFEDRLMTGSVPGDVVRDRTTLESGLVLSLESSGSQVKQEDRRVVRLVALRAEPGAPLSARVGSGPFVARWSGFVKADLATPVTLQAEYVGSLSMTIQGGEVLQGETSEPAVLSSGAMTLHAGLNPISVELKSLHDGRASIRLLWQRGNDVREPVRPESLLHDPTAEPALAEQRQWRLGRELVGRYRCTRCHGVSTAVAMPELKLDLPSLTTVGDRLSAKWLSRWISDPQAMYATKLRCRRSC